MWETAGPLDFSAAPVGQEGGGRFVGRSGRYGQISKVRRAAEGGAPNCALRSLPRPVVFVWTFFTLDGTILGLNLCEPREFG